MAAIFLDQNASKHKINDNNHDNDSAAAMFWRHRQWLYSEPRSSTQRIQQYTIMTSNLITMTS